MRRLPDDEEWTQGFLEAAGLTIAGLWTLAGGLAKINGLRSLIEWLFMRQPVAYRMAAESGSYEITPRTATLVLQSFAGEVKATGEVTLRVIRAPGTGTSETGTAV
jgi:hypothetical protein